MDKILTIIKKLILLFVVLFIASIVVYMTNADMKLSAKMAKLLAPWYDKMERDRRM